MTVKVAEDLVALLKSASQSAVDEAMLTRGSAWIGALEREFPAVHLFIQSLLYKSPEDVLDGLALINDDIRPFIRHPGALAYIGALQERLRGKTIR